jgi:hypothetical protein
LFVKFVSKLIFRQVINPRWGLINSAELVAGQCLSSFPIIAFFSPSPLSLSPISTFPTSLFQTAHLPTSLLWCSPSNTHRVSPPHDHPLRVVCLQRIPGPQIDPSRVRNCGPQIRSPSYSILGFGCPLLGFGCPLLNY